MSDIDCPYCGHNQKINHDDGYGYEEDRLFEQDCFKCGKTFNFETSILYCYSAYCFEGEHDLEDVQNNPGAHSCTRCNFLEFK